MRTWSEDRTNSSSTAVRSCSMADGKLVASAPQFEESLLLVDFIDGVPQPSTVIAEPTEEALAYCGAGTRCA